MTGQFAQLAQSANDGFIKAGSPEEWASANMLPLILIIGGAALWVAVKGLIKNPGGWLAFCYLVMFLGFAGMVVQTFPIMADDAPLVRFLNSVPSMEY